MSTNWNVTIEAQALEMLIGSVYHRVAMTQNQIREARDNRTTEPESYRRACNTSIDALDAAVREFGKKARQAKTYADIRGIVKGWADTSSERGVIASEVYALTRAALNAY